MGFGCCKVGSWELPGGGFTGDLQHLIHGVVVNIQWKVLYSVVSSVLRMCWRAGEGSGEGGQFAWIIP